MLGTLLTIDTQHICFHWYIFPSKCVWKACFPILLAHGEIPASGSMPPSRWLPPHEKNKIEQGGPSSPLEPSEGAFELTHGSACIYPRGALWWGTFQWGSHGGEKIHHRGVSSGWSSIWSCSNIGSPGQQDEHIPILFGVWPFAWLFSFHFRAIGFDGVLVKFYYICQNCSSSSGWYIIAACVSTIVLGFS